MSETLEESGKSKRKNRKQSGGERLWRVSRDINAIGALAIAGVAAVIPGPNVVLASWAGINAAQAGGSELLRRRSKKKNTSTDSTK